MSEHEPSIPEHTQQLGEAIAVAGIGLRRYRDFLGRKVARVFMDEAGLTNPSDERLDTLLERILGTGVASGIALSMRGDTSQADIDEHVSWLCEQMPETLHRSLGIYTAHMIEWGIDFHRQEMSQGSERLAQWQNEFQQLQAADPRHEFWGE